MLHGGSWLAGPWFLRSAVRNRFSTGDRYYIAGFRIARGRGQGRGARLAVGGAGALYGAVSGAGEDGMMARAGVRGRLGPALGLAAAVVLSVLPVAVQAAQRVALVIGNSDYHDDDADLRNPGNDADGMAAALGRLGFEVVLGKDLDRGGFYDKLDEFVKASHRADVALFFYAGHGLQVDGKNWLVPVDARLESKRDLERRAVKLDTVMDDMPGRHNLVFLDACRTNPLAAEMARSMGLSRAAEAATRGLVRAEEGSGRFIGYATAENDVADDEAKDGEGRHSPFTKALLSHIETPGLSVPDMFNKVVESVYDATGGQQVPWQSSSLRGDPIYLAPEAAPTTPGGTGTATAGGTSPPSGDAARSYEATERAGTVGAYRAFIKRFPNTLQADLAREQIAKLEGAKEPLVVAGGDPVETKAPSAAPSPEAVEQGLGLSREDRRLVQMGLAAAGYDPGPADGMIGRGTREAIRRWQGAQGEPETGYLDADGAKALLAMGATTMLTVRTVPPDARIRVFTTAGATYRDGMRLSPGQYEVSVEAKDHEPFRQKLAVEGPTSYRISLCKLEMRTEQICEDKQVERSRTERKTTLVDVEEDASVEVSELLEEKGRSEDSYERKAERRSSLRRSTGKVLCNRAEDKLQERINDGNFVVPDGGSEYMRSECASLGGKFHWDSLEYIGDGDRYDGNDCSCDDLYYAFDECTATATWQCEVTKDVQVPYSVTEKECRDETRPQRICPSKIVTRLQ